MSRNSRTATQVATSLDISAICATMRKIAHEHIDGYNVLDTDALVSTAYHEIECRPLTGSVPTAYLLALGTIEHEHKENRA